MNEEEIMNIENEDVEVEEVEDDETESNFGFVKLATVGAIITGAVGIIAYKNRLKFEERQIRKLEKKGYVITKPKAPDAEVIDVDAKEPESEPTPEEKK